MFARLTSLGNRLAARFAWVPPTLARVLVGLDFFHNGRAKWRDLSAFEGRFREWGIPAPAVTVVVVAAMELVGGLCLIPGVLSRFMAAGLCVTMSVAFLTVEIESFDWAVPLSSPALAYLCILVWIAVYGPGPLSLDRTVLSRLGIFGQASPIVPASSSQRG